MNLYTPTETDLILCASTREALRNDPSTIEKLKPVLLNWRYASQQAEQCCKAIVAGQIEDAALIQGGIDPAFIEQMNNTVSIPSKISSLAADVAKESTEQWPAPDPLINEAETPLPFPVEALPPIIKDAVCAYQAYGQQPIEIVISSALAACSLASQGQIDVVRDSALQGPVSLNILTVADSGERKTSADSVFKAPLQTWQDEEKERLKPIITEYMTNLEAWKAEHDGLVRRIKNLTSTGEAGQEIKSCKADLLKLMESKPVNVFIPNPFHEDCTREALGDKLAHKWPSASVWTDEGGLVIGAHAMKAENQLAFLGQLNRYWDGKPTETGRRSTAEVSLTGRRLTANLMMQDVVLRRLIGAGNEGASRGTGFLARFLISKPITTMGHRLYRKPGYANSMAALEDCLKSILNMPLRMDSSGAMQPFPLKLSKAAFHVWRDYVNEIEQGMADHKELCTVRDFAAKSNDQAARIAAILHFLTSSSFEDIPVQAMEAGCLIAKWYLSEAKRLFASMEKSDEIISAETLLDWFLNKNLYEVKSGYLLTHGPGSLRSPKKRDAALTILAEKNIIKEVKAGKSTLIQLNPKISGGT